MHLHDKSSEVCIKTRSTLASLSSKGQVTEQTTVKWSTTSIIQSFFCTAANLQAPMQPSDPKQSVSIKKKTHSQTVQNKKQTVDYSDRTLPWKTICTAETDNHSYLPIGIAK